MRFFRGESYSSSVAFLGFKASEFMLVEEIVRKLPIQFAQDELRVLFIVPSQGGHGEQQFGERLEKMPSFGGQFKFLQSFVPIRVSTSGPL